MCLLCYISRGRSRAKALTSGASHTHTCTCTCTGVIQECVCTLRTMKVGYCPVAIAQVVELKSEALFQFQMAASFSKFSKIITPKPFIKYMYAHKTIHATWYRLCKTTFLGTLLQFRCREEVFGRLKLAVGSCYCVHLLHRPLPVLSELVMSLQSGEYDNTTHTHMYM